MSEMGRDFLKAYTTYTEMMKPQVRGEITPCVKQIYQMNYWEAKEILGRVTTRLGVYAIIGITAGGAALIVTFF